MRQMQYVEPISLPEALETLAQYGDEAKVLAGGQSLLLMLHRGLIHPGVLIGLQRVSDLDRIAYEAGDGLRLGAMTTQRAIETSPLVRQHCRVLAYAVGLIASVHVRTLATLGGNLCHNLPGSDPPPALIALDAVFSLASTRGSRDLAVTDFFLGFLETAVKPDELLTEIRFPAASLGSRTVYLKHCVRGVDPALVGVAVRLALAGDGVTCTDIRIGVGGVSYIPYRAAGVEKMLRGERLGTNLIATAAQTGAAECDPLTDAHGSANYRRRMLEVFLRRAVAAAWHGGDAPSGSKGETDEVSSHAARQQRKP